MLHPAALSKPQAEAVPHHVIIVPCSMYKNCDGHNMFVIADAMACVCHALLHDHTWQKTFAWAEHDPECMAQIKRYPDWGMAQLAADKLVAPATIDAIDEFVYRCQVRLPLTLMAR